MNLLITYKTVADLINNAQKIGAETVTYFDSMIDTLSSSEILEESTDRQRLESQINVTSGVMTNYHQLYTRQMKDFVFTLQKFIDDNYLSVNDFLSDNNIKVLPIFADISRTVGYPIDDENIDSGDIS